MYLIIITAPLLGSIFSGLLGRHVGRQGSSIITICLMTLSFFVSLFIFYEVVYCHSICTIRLGTWISSNELTVYWGFLFDSLTAVMLVVVTSISTLVHIYSTGYMAEDPHLPRFMSYLSLFTFFMLMLVTADNFVQMFLGWEGVGLASYLLINFWHTRIQANKAAMKAMIINRIGDLGIILGISAIFFVFKSLDFAIVFSIAPLVVGEKFLMFGYNFDKITVICVLLFIGAVGKSAQIGLHTWLPDAMEGPTPVSALIHAATMVTAGVFVILRCSPILEYSEDALFIITIVGALTAFMAATIGVVQNDLKKVIAYSTCSQLGYMVFAAGLSNYSVSLFHLMNHAFFKALLFLSAGSVIHAMSDEQDMRKMGGLLKVMPITYVMMLIGSLSLMGFPFLTGFYSKDILLELTFGTYKFSGLFAYTLGTLSAALTSFYSMRLIYLTFLTNTNSPKPVLQNAHESSFLMLFPLFILAIGSIFIGYIFKELFLGLGVDTWNGALFTLPEHVSQFEAEFLPVWIKLIPVICSIWGAIASLAFYKFCKLKKEEFSLKDYKENYPYLNFFSKKWFFDNIYNKLVVEGAAFIGYHVSFKEIDRGFIEILGPLSITRFIKWLSDKISSLQTGLIYHYIFIMVLFITFSLLLFFTPVLLKPSLVVVYLFSFLFLIYKRF